MIVFLEGNAKVTPAFFKDNICIIIAVKIVEPITEVS
jgi:hypothetical protein